jgi:hypothetical protein
MDPAARPLRPEVREALDGVQGIHFERVLQRFYPNGDVARELLGSVGLDGVAQGGLELEFDSVLSGRPGRAVVRRDSRGRPLPGAMVRAVEPTPGRDVYLTIDYDLQEIAEQALREAVERTGRRGRRAADDGPADGRGAGGGEPRVAAGPATGARSRTRTSRAPPSSRWWWRRCCAWTAPGFTDSMYAERRAVPAARSHAADVKPLGWVTLEEALRYSSNIAWRRRPGGCSPTSSTSA